jgi:hypothetical protein
MCMPRMTSRLSWQTSKKRRCSTTGTVAPSVDYTPIYFQPFCTSATPGMIGRRKVYELHA